MGNNNGLGENAHFYSIRGMTSDSSGNIYAVDRLYEDGYYQENQIRRISPSGWVTTFAGDITNSIRTISTQGYANGTSNQITFDWLYSIAFGP